MSVLCMKTRTVLLFVVILFGSITITILFYHQDKAPPTWSNLVSETQKHLSNLKKLNEKPGLHKIAEAEPYLRRLGFDDSELNINAPKDSEAELLKLQPVVAIPALSGDGSDVVLLLKTIRKYLPKYSVFVYDLGLGFFERRTVRTACNRTSASRCQVRPLDWDIYPSHIQILKYVSHHKFRSPTHHLKLL